DDRGDRIHLEQGHVALLFREVACRPKRPFRTTSHTGRLFFVVGFSPNQLLVEAATSTSASPSGDECASRTRIGSSSTPKASASRSMKLNRHAIITMSKACSSLNCWRKLSSFGLGHRRRADRKLFGEREHRIIGSAEPGGSPVTLKL